MEKRLEKNKSRRDSHYTAKNNIESVGSESSRGESFDSGYQEIIQEENMILPPVPQEEPQCVSTL